MAGDHALFARGKALCWHIRSASDAAGDVWPRACDVQRCTRAHQAMGTREELVVDPVSLIVGALAAGASEGVTETATTAVKDAYAALRRLVSKLFQGQPVAEALLDEHAKNPDGPYEQNLKTELDEQALAPTRRLSRLRGSCWRPSTRTEPRTATTTSICVGRRWVRWATTIPIRLRSVLLRALSPNRRWLVRTARRVDGWPATRPVWTRAGHRSGRLVITTPTSSTI